MKPTTKQKNGAKVSISKEDISHVAKLANIEITQKEHKNYSEELSKIINYNIEHLKNIDTDKIEPTAHAVGEKSITRDDITLPGLNDIEATNNASETHHKFFKVKRIFGAD